jgi:hypothetical protein
MLTATRSRRRAGHNEGKGLEAPNTIGHPAFERIEPGRMAHDSARRHGLLLIGRMRRHWGSPAAVFPPSSSPPRSTTQYQL